MGACLWAGSGTAASHRTAAHLFGLQGFAGGCIEISTFRRLERTDVVVHQRTHALQAVRIDRIPVTGVALTLIDLAAVGSLDLLEKALDDVLVRRLISKDRLQVELHGVMKALPGAAILRRSLESYNHAPLESPLERKFLRLMRAAGLPEPGVQYPIRDGDRFLVRDDFAYPDLRLALEVDGFRWHGAAPDGRAISTGAMSSPTGTGVCCTSLRNT